MECHDRTVQSEEYDIKMELEIDGFLIEPAAL